MAPKSELAIQNSDVGVTEVQIRRRRKWRELYATQLGGIAYKVFYTGENSPESKSPLTLAADVETLDESDPGVVVGIKNLFEVPVVPPTLDTIQDALDHPAAFASKAGWNTTEIYSNLRPITPAQD